MKKNECFSLTAERLGADLEGVCIHDGMPVFVPGMLPGERADVRIVKAEKRYAFGRMESAPDPVSQERRSVDCPAYPRCGGCSARHMSYKATLSAKRQQVEDCFRRISGISTEVQPVLGMDHPFGYRNKTSLPAGGSDSEPVLGFYAPRSHAVIPAAACPNAMPPADALAAAFLAWMKMFHVKPYREDTRQGLIRHLVIRINRKGESMVTVVANAGSLPHTKELTEALVPLGTVSLWLNENRTATNVILSEKFHLIYGKETLTDTLFDLQFELSPASFFQVNPEQTEKLYRTALDFAGLKPSDLLCDVYCGAGTITLTMARHCHEAIGIEIVPAAVENAKRNAVRNGIGNVSFLAGRAEDLLPQMVADGLRPDVIVVDPPRKGLDPAVIRAMAQAGPDRLVYVSCNPATLARDAGLLREVGYEIRIVQPVDMFCWTSGVETVALLSRNKMTHHMNLNPAPYEMMKSGLKTIELRLYDEKRQKIKPGDTIVFTNTDTGATLSATVLKLHCFQDFEKLYQTLPLLQCGYSEENVAQAKPSDMEQYYSSEEQKKYGVVGIELFRHEETDDKTADLLNKADCTD